MWMRLHIIFTVGYSLFLLACSKTDDSVKMVSVDVEEKRATPDSVIFASREIVILETVPESLLSYVLMMDLYRDDIYVLDDRRTAVFVFSRTGEYKTKIGRQGRGPGEYGHIMSFYIDRDKDEIAITTDRPNRIMYYSFAGEFLGETETEEIICGVVKTGDKLNARLLHDTYDFGILEMDGHVVKSVEFPDTPELSVDRHRRISPFGEYLTGSRYGILFTRTFDNTLYKVEDGKLIPFITLDFGRYWQHNANTLDHAEITRRVSEGREIYAITNARLTGEDKVIFNGYPNGVFVVDGDTARHYGGITSELSLSPFGKTEMIPILDPETDRVAFAYNAMEFSHLSRKEDRSGYTDEMHRLAALNEGDNPVIFLYKLR